MHTEPSPHPLALRCGAVTTAGRHTAVLFDLGGVVFPSPFEAFDRYDERAGLQVGFTRALIRTSSETGAWAALERGEVTMTEFFIALEQEAAELGETVDAARIMATIGEESGPRPEMLEAIVRLRRANFRVGALTNNWANDSNGPRSPGDRDDLFDVMIESSKVGLRKPDPRIYTLALDQLGVGAHETVFLDDLGINLKPAREMGMTTIKVVDHHTALGELEAVLGLTLKEMARND
jgi:putative hydrolase of the HAD superfamily